MLKFSTLLIKPTNGTQSEKGRHNSYISFKAVVKKNLLASYKYHFKK